MAFTIDSTDTAVIEAAYDAVVSDCLLCCSSDECERNFAIVEAHHDFCLHDQVPHRVETGFHDLEEVCAVQCTVGRLKDPDHQACPNMACPDSDATVETVVQELGAEGCAT